MNEFSLSFILQGTFSLIIEAYHQPLNNNSGKLTLVHVKQFLFYLWVSSGGRGWELGRWVNHKVLSGWVTPLCRQRDPVCVQDLEHFNKKFNSTVSHTIR